MPLKSSIPKGKNQVLFSFLPSQLIEYPQSNVVVLVKNWASTPSDIPSKNRIIQKLYKVIFNGSSKYGSVDDVFPRKADSNQFYFGEPNFVNCELFPLVFTEEKSKRAHVFRSVKDFNVFLNNWNGGKLRQWDLVFINDDGEMDQLQPVIDIRRIPLKLEKYGESQAAYRWVNADTNEKLDRVFGIVSGRRVNEGTPARAKRTFLPQIITLVNIRNYVEVGESEKELVGCIILSWYIYNPSEKISIRQEYEKLKTFDNSFPEQKAKEYAQALGVDFNSLSDETKKKLFSIGADNKNKISANLSEIQSNFSNFEILSASESIYEFMETLNSQSRITFQDMISCASSEAKKAKYQQFIKKLDDIGICSATYLDDVPLVNVAYGFVRGNFDTRETKLKPFPPDQFDKTHSKIPIYLTQMNTEGILLEIDRRKIIEYLKEKGTIEILPEEGKEKKWFIKNVDPSLMTRFSGVIEEGITKDVFSLIHTLSHVLIKQIPDQCGIGIDQLGEIIFPNIPAILIFSKEMGEFKLGALKDLFENKIYPWVDISFQQSRPGFCFYDPVCFGGQGACYSCLFLNEFTCGYFNQDLSRHVLFGDVSKKTNGFWDTSLKKF